MCCASFCFGLKLYVRAIAVTVESSTPSSLDITTKFALGMTIREFLDHTASRRINRREQFFSESEAPLSCHRAYPLSSRSSCRASLVLPIIGFPSTGKLNSI